MNRNYFDAILGEKISELIKRMVTLGNGNAGSETARAV